MKYRLTWKYLDNLRKVEIRKQKLKKIGQFILIIIILLIVFILGGMTFSYLN